MAWCEIPQCTFTDLYGGLTSQLTRIKGSTSDGLVYSVPSQIYWGPYCEGQDEERPMASHNAIG